VRDGYYGRYLPSGHLIYLHDRTLFAVRFDLQRLEVAGAPQPVIENVANNAASGGAEIAFSNNGTLAYVPGRTVTGSAAILWADSGRRLPTLRAEPSVWSGPRFAPDGRSLAMAVLDRGQNDIWVYDWTADRMQRQTVGAGNNESPVWSTDGQRIVFSSTRGRSDGSNLFWQRADSTSGTQQLTDTETLKRRRKRAGRLEAGHAATLPQRPVRRAERDVLAGRTLGRV
jgi:serine/threonine-protein kinase